MIDLAALQGHWHRDWIKAPEFEDTTTHVHWLQCGPVFADIRIPAHKPDIRGAQCLADLPERRLALIAKSEGFAGEIKLDDDVCTWRRDINWHGVADGVDAGKLWFEPDGALIEDGVHARYRERWSQVGFEADHGLRLLSDDMVAFLVSVDGAFVFGAEPVAARPEGYEGLFASTYVLGRWENGLGVATLSTNPFLQGKPVLECDGDTILFQHVDFHGAARTVALTSRAMTKGHAA